MNLFKKSAAVVALLTLVSGLFSTGTNAYSQAQIEAANYLASQ
jgi:Na+-translocating ferredoxin:NAD+ oxidoreductase RnfG subunit